MVARSTEDHTTKLLQNILHEEKMWALRPGYVTGYGIISTQASSLCTTDCLPYIERLLAFQQAVGDGNSTTATEHGVRTGIYGALGA